MSFSSLHIFGVLDDAGNTSSKSTHVKRRHRPKPCSSAGFSQVEALVASAVLMMAVSQSLNLYGSTLQATGKAQLRDGINAAINADLEQIRHTISTWALTESSDGQLAYSPSNEACESGALASSLLADHAASLPTSSSRPHQPARHVDRDRAADALCRS